MDHVPLKADLPTHHPREIQVLLQVPLLRVMLGRLQLVLVGYLGGFPVDLQLQMIQAAAQSIHCRLGR